MYICRHHQIVLITRNMLTLSLSLSRRHSIHPYRPSLPGGLPNDILYPYRADVLDGWSILARLCVGVHRRTSLMSLSLLVSFVLLG